MIEDAPNVVLDTMKRAEDSNDIIVRIYEAYGGHAKARLVWYVCDRMGGISMEKEKFVLKTYPNS